MIPDHTTPPTKELGIGEQVLEVLVNFEHDGLYSGSTWLGDIVRRLDWAHDGRSVSRPLRKLEQAGLIEKVALPHPKNHWRPTERGREVDHILRDITVARGGRFLGRHASGLNFYESSALR
jgi:DNA-binding MarR family transcriptional regulator